MEQEKPCGAIAWIKNLPIACIGLPMAALTGIASCFLNVTLSISRGKLGDPMLAALLMYMSGVVLSAILFPSPVAELYSTRQQERLKFKWWMCLSGVCGVAISAVVACVASGIPLVLVTLSYNIGQLLSSFAADHFGFLGGEKRRFTKMKLCSLLMFILGLLLFSVKDDTLEFRLETLLLVLAGMGATVQASINRRTSEAVPHKVQAMGVQFLSGFVTLSIVWTFRTVINTKFEVVEHLPWYMFMVPIFICIPILFNYFVFAPKAGMALFAMVAILSEITSSLIMDRLQLFTVTDARPFSLFMALGIAAAFAGTVLTALGQVDWSNSNSDGAGVVLKHQEQVMEHRYSCSTEPGDSDRSETPSSCQRTPSSLFSDSIQQRTSGTHHSSSLEARLQRRQDEECAPTRHCIESNEGNSAEHTVCEIV